jgi:hypothetical protein
MIKITLKKNTGGIRGWRVAVICCGFLRAIAARMAA